MANREKRAQEFMNKMADTVIKNMDEKQRMEDEMIRKYEMEKELRERMEDERKMKEDRDHKAKMARFLHKQMEEKQNKEHLEKALNDE